MSRINQSSTFTLGDRVVQRVGFVAMQLAGPDLRSASFRHSEESAAPCTFCYMPLLRPSS